MSTVHDTPAALRELEEWLAAAPQGTLSSDLAEERIRHVLRLLTKEDPRWIGTCEAMRLLGIELERAIPAWVQLGLLRGRESPAGHLEVRLDDVLRERAVREALLAIGGDELTAEELRELKETRPGKNPWERTQSDPPS